MSLNAEEIAALEKLAVAIRAIRALVVVHPADHNELTLHFHAIQEKIMARAAVRAHPELFPTSSTGFERFK
jgi:hypothetical protein